MTPPTPSVRKRRLTGTVVSHAMQETAVVVVTRVKMHPRYHKRMRVSSRFKAHNAANTFKTGDRVLIEECRPLSKDKRWRIVRLTKHEIV